MDDPQNPPASGGSKTFGIHKYNPEYCLGERSSCFCLPFAHCSPSIGSGAQREDRRRGYEDKYEDDPPYEELGDNARIWRVMLDEGRANDAAMLQRFRDHLDVDLVFAGLFSAVLTTFVVQTSQTPSSAGDTTIALLLEIIAIQRAWADNPRVNDVASFSLPPPSPSPSPWINRCWYLSLIFSLLAAFGAVVVRQWLQEYESDIHGPPRQRALVRHYRRVGLEKYKVHLIVPILPMLLHVSLLLFFIGLTLYALLPFFHRNISSAALHVHALEVRIHAHLPLHLQSAFSTSAKTVKRRLERTHGILRDRLRSFRGALKGSWKQVFKTPDAHEWEAVLDSSDTMIPDSLDSMVQASSDLSHLSITPLVVQASSSLPIDDPHYGNYGFEDPRYKELLRRRVLPWFFNALSTQRTVFDWAPGRENELQRMACALLLVPIEYQTWPHDYTVLWSEFDTDQYHTCISRILQALMSALLDLPTTPTVTMTDVATTSMTLLALGNRLVDLDLDLKRNSKLVQTGALFDNITAAYSSLPELPSLAVLRLRPVIWHHALTYLRYYGRPMDDATRFAITLWQHAYSEASFPDGDGRKKQNLVTSTRLNLQEWVYLRPGFSESVTIAMYHLLCPRSCESHESHERDNADGNASFDDNLGFLAVQFIAVLVTTLGYGSIESALRCTGHPVVAAAFKSTFLARLALLSTAKFWEADACLSATLAVSLFWFLAKLAKAITGRDEKVAVLKVLNHHATDYCDVLTEALHYDEISIDLLLDLTSGVLNNPQLGILAIPDALAASLATQLRKTGPRNLHEFSMHHCLYLDALCAARANSELVDKKFPDASRKLHSVLLLLDPTYHETWKSELTLQLKEEHIPLAVAFALNSTHGCKALAETATQAWRLRSRTRLDLARTWIGMIRSCKFHLIC
ncbi:hypothetical protein EV714DRAFT_220732 [Schizophyllum commune]